MPEVLGGIAAAIAIVGAVIKGGNWIVRKLRGRKALKARPPSAGLPTDPYPVRLECREHTEFHPSSGFHEGLVFEVFNFSDKPVTVKGFGLDITMRGQAEWHQYEQARQHPRHDFPLRLAPHDGIDGYIDTEALADEMYTRGESEYVVEWRPYVEVSGYGEMHADVAKST